MVLPLLNPVWAWLSHGLLPQTSMFGVPRPGGRSAKMIALVFLVALVGKLLALALLLPIVAVLALLFFVTRMIKK